MEMQSKVIVHCVKESVGAFEGKAFSSTTFHCEVDMKENGAGRAIGRVTRPFKFGDAKEFDKWAHLGKSLPCSADAIFDIEAVKEVDGGSGIKMVLKSITPSEIVLKKAA
ncbi:hypothetical protein [Rhodoferax sp.]|uniref:hypothetical protein n=1 Tax=Rhodoferax sp. TaxID=50421 RepID=UPI00271A68F4|nr:hypothetical protein [Rhodoferax sp.]MDO9195870.1 hypothetical protein [Rhodoferax sp.]